MKGSLSWRRQVEQDQESFRDNMSLSEKTIDQHYQEQDTKAKVWINKEIAAKYPGAVLMWTENTVTVEVPSSLWTVYPEIPEAVRSLMSYYPRLQQDVKVVRR